YAYVLTNVFSGDYHRSAGALLHRIEHALLSYVLDDLIFPEVFEHVQGATKGFQITGERFIALELQLLIRKLQILLPPDNTACPRMVECGRTLEIRRSADWRFVLVGRGFAAFHQN